MGPEGSAEQTREPMDKNWIGGLRCLAARERGRGSSHGIDGTILETGVGSAGKVLESDTREARRRKTEVRNVASGAGAVQSRTTGTQEGFPRCRTPGEAAGGRNLTLSFVPDAEQRLWRTVTRKKYQLRCDRVRLCRTNWSLFWNRPISSCPASSPICWASVPGGC